MSLDPYYQEKDILLYHGDCLDILPQLKPESIQCCVTSPPYWGLRDYGVEGQLGLEKTPEEYVERMVKVFSLVNRALRPDGTLWLNLGDSYAGSWGAQSRPNGNDIKSTLQSASRLSARQIKEHPKGTLTGSLKNTPGLKPKDLVGIPWRVAFALQSAGWYLRSDIIWHKPNPMPESVTDRPTKAHEYIFLMAKSGNTLLWRHMETKEWTYEWPEPDYRWINNLTGETVSLEPDHWKDKLYYKPEDIDQEKPLRLWSRRNMWAGHDYYYDHEAVKETLQECSIKRMQTGWNGNKKRGWVNGNQNNLDKYMGSDKAKKATNRSKRTVWTVTTKPYKGAHFAVFPPELIEPCILAGTKEGDIVLDPFNGSGTVGHVCKKHGRRYIGIELNKEYLNLNPDRIGAQQFLL